MKIDGLSNYLTNSLQTISELNLKEGQIIMGKIISLGMDEALLEIAGRPLMAKVEGNPAVATGSAATFQVRKDEMGRILLKFMASFPDSAGVVSEEINLEKFSSTADLKNIWTALSKEGVVPSPENIDKLWRSWQDFQLKYQQPLNPRVIAFIMGKKWPVTPGTILTSLVFQDQEAREILWNLLKKSLPEKEFAEFINKYALVPQAGSESLTRKMIVYNNLKNLGDLLGRLFKLNSGNPELPDMLLKADLKNIPGKTTTGADLPNPKTAAEIMRSETKFNDPSIPSAPERPGVSERSNISPEFRKTDYMSKMLEIAGKLSRAEQQKIAAVLEQHIAVAKSVPSGESTANPYYAIPFLLNDPESGLRELIVKWREESSRSKSGKTGQLVLISIPTANMGEVNLTLQVTDTGARINFKVDTAEIRKYLSDHITELKEAISHPETGGPPHTAIVVGLKANDAAAGTDSGLDLWM